MTETQTVDELQELESCVAQFADDRSWRIAPQSLWNEPHLGSSYADLRHESGASVSVRVSDHAPTGSGDPVDVYLFPSDLKVWDWVLENTLLPALREALETVIDDDYADDDERELAQIALDIMQ